VDRTEELRELVVELHNARELRRRQLSALKKMQPGAIKTSLEYDVEANAVKIRDLIERRKIVGRILIKSRFSNKRRQPFRRRRT
jgi:hypothetical protein